MSSEMPGRGSDQFPLRLPDGMRNRIKKAANASGRSMNAEIVATLEKAYPPVEIELEHVSELIKALLGEKAPKDHSEYMAMLHNLLENTERQWSVKADSNGRITLIPNDEIPTLED